MAARRSQVFESIAALTGRQNHALDVATGNGQAATGLAEFFDRVTATDASPEQLAEATPHARITYATAAAEQLPVDDESVDLITVAQALHWFDHPAFFAEVERALVPAGVLAVWSYRLFEVSPTVDDAVLEFYENVTCEYWPPERALVDDAYRSISFPMDPVELWVPPLVLRWTADDALAYISTWSGTRRYAAATGEPPLATLELALRRAWGSEPRAVRWPLTFVARRKPPRRA